MANPRVLKNFNLFVDGRGYAGRIDELELPELTVKTEEHRAGGMDAPIDIDLGLEAMEATATLSDYDENVIRLFGLANGSAVQVTARGAMQRDGEAVVPVVCNLRGSIKGMATGSWAAGEKATLELTFAVRYYRLEIGGENLIEIDVENMIRKIGGTDQLEGIRSAIGV